jgi:AhpD family alkylhydroperoxidase
MRTFSKQTFSLPLLARSLAAATVRVPVLVVALVRPATSRALREKVMLAVSSVNDCRYCSWVHTELALANGVDLAGLQEVLDHETFGEVASGEATAILFGQHFAATARQPTAEARAALAREFTIYQRAEIMAYIHGIYFLNLSGNSYDAWLARFAGQKVETGHPTAEAVAALLLAPVLAVVKLFSREGPVSVELG